MIYKTLFFKISNAIGDSKKPFFSYLFQWTQYEWNKQQYLLSKKELIIGQNMIIHIVQPCDLCNALYKVINNLLKSKLLPRINQGLKRTGA